MNSGKFCCRKVEVMLFLGLCCAPLLATSSSPALGGTCVEAVLHLGIPVCILGGAQFPPNHETMSQRSPLVMFFGW